MDEVLIDLSAKSETPSKAAIGPATPDLRAMFDYLNAELFDGYLPLFEVKWCENLRVTAGICQWQKSSGIYSINYIRLSVKLFRQNGWEPSEIRMTLIHEMAHAYLILRHGIRGHGRAFQNLMHRLVGWRKSHTYHTYDVKGLRNTKRSRVEVYCVDCEKVIGHRGRKPNAKSIERFVHTGCGGKTLYRTVPLENSGGMTTILNLSSRN